MLANVDTFIIRVGFGLMNVDTIHTLTRHEHDSLTRIATPRCEDNKCHLIGIRENFEGGMCRSGKIGPSRWASPVRPKLGPGWAIKLLAGKKSSQIWPRPVWPSLVWPGPVRPARIFFDLEKTIWPDRPGF